MAKVKRGLRARPYKESRSHSGVLPDSSVESRADERERIRVLIVGGTPEARNAVAMMVEFAVSRLGSGTTGSTFVEKQPTAVEAVMAIEGYRITIRDGGS